MNIKKIEDYYDKILERFPDLSKTELDKILKHGMRSFYILTVYGADILLMNQKFTMYFGELYRDSKKQYNYRKSKHINRARFSYRSGFEPWDGYYYVCCTNDILEKEHLTDTVFESEHTFKKLQAYKLKKECIAMGANGMKVFRFKIPETKGWWKWLDNETVKDLEPVGYITNKWKLTNELCEKK